MYKTRLEAFSDGVLAIIITIMVLELKVPHDPSLDALVKLLPVFISYIMSFFFVAIYWVNHHHLLHCIEKVNARILWANIGLLFALSLVPFTTGWIGENHFSSLPTTLYCANLFLCGLAAGILQRAISHGLPRENKIFVVIKQNMKKTIFSVIVNIIAIIVSFWYPIIAVAHAAFISVIWVIPDRRIEKLMEQE